MLLTIYMPLLNEGTDCWRPVEAEPISGDHYRIVTEKPEDEVWPWANGQIVVCERKTFRDGKSGLVAVGLA